MNPGEVKLASERTAEIAAGFGSTKPKLNSLR